MVSIAMDAPVSRSRWARWLVGSEIVVAAAIVGIGLLVSATLDAGHATYHVIFSMVGLAPAAVLALRRPHGGQATTAPLLGFAVLAATQFVEGIGAFGFGADGNERVNGVVALHDLGLGLAPLGLTAGAVGLALGVARLVAARTKRPLLAALVSVGILAPMLFLIAKLSGL